MKVNIRPSSVFKLLPLKPARCNCGYWTAEDVFECAGCLKTVCNCKGQADKNFDLCDDCAYEKEN
jgi:hypothetical protein